MRARGPAWRGGGGVLRPSIIWSPLFRHCFARDASFWLETALFRFYLKRALRARIYFFRAQRLLRRCFVRGVFFFVPNSWRPNFVRSAHSALRAQLLLRASGQRLIRRCLARRAEMFFFCSQFASLELRSRRQLRAARMVLRFSRRAFFYFVMRKMVFLFPVGVVQFPSGVRIAPRVCNHFFRAAFTSASPCAGRFFFAPILRCGSFV